MRLCRVLGLVVIAGGWVVIGAAWLLNRGWWRFLGGAFSDLGSSRACCPWVFNTGLMAVGLVLAALGYCLYRRAAAPVSIVGAGYLGLSGLFLFQVGLFPEGTRFHTCVSLWFFLLADLGLFLYLLPARRANRCCEAGFASAAAMVPVGLLVAATVGWPSTAALEAYAVILLDAAVAAATLCCPASSTVRK
jgi:hypothetical membrane protein